MTMVTGALSKLRVSFWLGEFSNRMLGTGDSYNKSDSRLADEAKHIPCSTPHIQSRPICQLLQILPRPKTNKRPIPLQPCINTAHCVCVYVHTSACVDHRVIAPYQETL